MSQVATTTEKPVTVTMGFGSLESFEFMQRTARMFSVSSMVPTAYRETIVKGYGQNQTVEANPSAVPNAMIALNMAQRMNADPLMIMQNLHVIEGRPSWSSPFIIAAINTCGRFSPLRYELVQGKEIDATHTTYEWENNKKKPVVQKVRVTNSTCIAWTVERGVEIPKFSLEDLRANGGLYGCCKLFGLPILESPTVSIEMAVNEGWYGKNGSKWQSMPDLMLRYRSGAFFGRLYAPEVLMGLPTSEELTDTIELTEGSDGGYTVREPVTPAAEPIKAPVSKSEAQRSEAAQPVQDVTPKVNPESTKAEEKQPVAPVESAQAATKTVAQKADPATGELPAKINAGQVKYLESKIRALEMAPEVVTAMLLRIGSDTLQDLTLEQFNSVKSELLSMGA